MNKPRHPLRAYRFERNLSMSDLARDMNLSTSTLHHMEYNHGHQTVRRVLKYCRDNHLKAEEVFFPCD